MSDRPILLITGAAGFIGGELRRQAAERFDVFAVDQRPLHPPARANETEIRCDLGDLDAVEELLERLRPVADRVAGVVLLAAYYDFSNEERGEYERLHRGHELLIPELARTMPADAAIVFASSMASLEPLPPGRKLTPESPRIGEWMYPKYKLKMERFLESLTIAQPIFQLVLAGVYSDLCELVPLYHALERVRGAGLENYFYPGPTDRGLTYVHVDECARAFLCAVDARQPSGVHRCLIGQREPATYAWIHRAAGEAFHGSGGALLRIPGVLAWSGAHILGGVARLAGRRRFVQPWMIRFADEHFEFDLTSARDILGWEPRRAVQSDLPQMLSTAVEDPERWHRANQARPW